MPASFRRLRHALTGAPALAMLAIRAPIAVRVLRARLTYLHPRKMARIVTASDRTRGLAGDVCEFGVALGGSGIVLAARMGPAQRFAGFDVFGMIPPPTSDKDDAKSRQRYAVIASGQSRGIDGQTYYGYRAELLAEVRAAFARFGVADDGARIRLIEGLFEDTLPTANIDRVALAHIDCDWYDPVRLCLAYCADRMAAGGIIVIDDYHDYGGCRTAVDEFLAERPDFAMEAGPNPFLVKAA